MKFAMPLVLVLIGCTGTKAAQDTTCENITRELTVGVPYAWAVMDEEINNKMNDGCTFTTITHYVFNPTDGGVGGAGGSAPDPRHCDVDACGGPLLRVVDFIDPLEINTSFGH